MYFNKLKNITQLKKKNLFLWGTEMRKGNATLANGDIVVIDFHFVHILDLLVFDYV